MRDYKKKYEQALSKAREFCKRWDCIDANGSSLAIDELKEIFPELKVSNSENIRKDLIKWIEEFPDMVWRGHQKKDIIAWLENQCETKQVTDFSNLKTWKLIVDAILTKENGIGQYLDSARTETLAKELLERFGNIQQKYFAPNVKPKFKIGDWIVFNGFTLLVNEVVQGYYKTISIGGICNSYDWDIDNIARLWTIKDAKDGDVLSSRHNQPFIYNGKFDDSLVGGYCGLQFSNLGFIVSTYMCRWTDNKDIKPATIEQREYLFAKMKSAGYIWDVEKKVLNKVNK